MVGLLGFQMASRKRRPPHTTSSRNIHSDTPLPPARKYHSFKGTVPINIILTSAPIYCGRHSASVTVEELQKAADNLPVEYEGRLLSLGHPVYEVDDAEVAERVRQLGSSEVEDISPVAN
jgi:hypothetical protein